MAIDIRRSVPTTEQGYDPLWEAAGAETLAEIDAAFDGIEAQRTIELETLHTRVEHLMELLESLSLHRPWSRDFRRIAREFADQAASIAREVMSRRAHGSYTVDGFGYDQEIATLAQPLLEYLFDRYWRVEVWGIENIPLQGQALYLANHSGLLPWDGLMARHAIQKARGESTHVRSLANANHFRVPFWGSLLASLGIVANYPDNGRKLLSSGESVIVFPGGDAALAKGFTDPYRVPTFINTDYVDTALDEGAAIVPVAIVGAHESYPILTRFDGIGRMLGLPMLPVTPFFPFAPPPLWLTPLPVKWIISFLPPVPVPEFMNGTGMPLGLATAIEEDAHALIQEELREMLARRGPLFG